MPLTATAMRLIMRQLQELETSPVEGVRVHQTDSLSDLLFDFAGPEGTPFDGGLFQVVLHFEDGYPEVPPRGVFRTKIFHPNIAEKGDICVNVLKRDWSPNLGLRHVLTVIHCLLIEPNAESALNEDAARLLLEDYNAYRRKAEMMKKVYAMKGARPPLESRQLQPADVMETQNQSQQQQKQDLVRKPPNVASPNMPAAEGGAGSHLRNASESALNTRSVEGGVSANFGASKKAVEKKRTALKRI
ncbi:ubiquitin-conjugating enzyme [Trypanosoma grayi]|uniref:ubiquitin-conjugating enzyme n=1 Tax=Trypanosoma grayi TaxID=71804 RepID=UPI0004F403A7|nr:ubiquitin-conjugating enzyme [Trypanosoma grayi]KEG10336.1 ubiquitin-conjugating enzyme [Trypanosoma grayi]